MNPLQRRLGQAVRRLREKGGYSQEGFADHVGVHRTYMGAVERGEQNISLANLERIAHGLGLKTWELLRVAEQDLRWMTSRPSVGPPPSMQFWSAKACNSDQR